MVRLIGHTSTRHFEASFSAGWLVSDGQLFVHIFCHRNLAYTFERDGEKNWMGRHFFSGGIMPARDLFLRYQRQLTVNRQWWIEGQHYARTCEAWLSKMDRNESEVKASLATVGGADSIDVMVQRWRMFFMACAELFKYGDGNEWGVGHYLFDVNATGGQMT